MSNTGPSGRIPLPNTNLRFSDIRDRYGGPSTNLSITEYYRAGGRVRNHQDNQNIPTFGQFNVGVMRGKTVAFNITMTPAIESRTLLGGKSSQTFRGFWNSEYSTWSGETLGSINRSLYGTSPNNLNQAEVVKITETPASGDGTNTLQLGLAGDLVGQSPFSFFLPQQQNPTSSTLWVFDRQSSTNPDGVFADNLDVAEPYTQWTWDVNLPSEFTFLFFDDQPLTVWLQG